jgi:hypothetical protein
MLRNWLLSPILSTDAGDRSRRTVIRTGRCSFGLESPSDDRSVVRRSTRGGAQNDSGRPR